jgi:multisubunit Na+/H+ antiporter MnhC subunit
VLFCVGLYCAVSKGNIIRIIIGLGIMEYAVNLFFIMVGYKKGGIPPIFSKVLELKKELMVDPLPQALILTAIVIGLAITALLVAIAIRIYQRYGTYDINELKKLKG